MSGGILAGLGALCLVAGFIIDRALHPGRRLEKRFVEFLDDWNGHDARVSGGVELEARKPPFIERMTAVERRTEKIEGLLNGNGLGAALASLSGKVDDHLTEAATSRDEILDDLREIRTDLTDAVTTLTANQQRIEDSLGDRLERVEGAVANRLFVLEERDRMQTAVLHEVGFDTELPPPRDGS